MLKKILMWAAILFVVYYIATQPGQAGTFVQHCLHGLRDAGQSAARFVNKL